MAHRTSLGISLKLNEIMLSVAAAQPYEVGAFRREPLEYVGIGPADFCDSRFTLAVLKFATPIN